MKLRYLIGFLCVALISLVTIKSCRSSNDTVVFNKNITTTSDCLFCKIAAHLEPAKVIAENDDVIVFESIHPRYPSHWLIIPKKHIKDLKSAQPEDTLLLGKLLATAGALGRQLESPGAFNIQINEGSQAGQTVFHLHLHFYSQYTLTTNSPKI
jgi:histidine triad (HIT) family protein